MYVCKTFRLWIQTLKIQVFSIYDNVFGLQRKVEKERLFDVSCNVVITSLFVFFWGWKKHMHPPFMLSIYSNFKSATSCILRYLSSRYFFNVIERENTFFEVSSDKNYKNTTYIGYKRVWNWNARKHLNCKHAKQ